MLKPPPCDRPLRLVGDWSVNDHRFLSGGMKGNLRTYVDQLESDEDYV